MTIKKKLMLTMALMALVTTLLMVGVWALKSTNFSIGGNINFTAKGVEATISKGVLSDTGLWATESDANTKMPLVNITTSMSQDDVDDAFAEWQGLDLLFNEDGDDVTITFTITNNAKNASNYIKVDVAVSQGALNNAGVAINKSSAIIAPGAENAQTFVITFRVFEKSANASLTGFALGFTMALAQPTETTQLSDFSFAFDETNKTATLADARTTITTANIPALISDGENVYTVTEIGENAFYNCKSFTSVSIPETVEAIGDDAFRNCTGLTSVSIPDSVEAIGGYSFYNCSSLTSVSIPETIEAIGGSAFDGCSKLTFETYENAKYLGNSNNPYLVLYSATSTDITSCTINSQCKFISDDAFASCASLASVSIPDGVEQIGDSAFYNCTSLTSVSISDSVTSIGGYAFSGCNITTFSATENGAKYLGNSNNPYVVLHSATSTDITSCTINSNCKFIHTSAFQSCGSLTSISIPDSVTSIGNAAFSGCSGLTSITIPESVISIGNNAFQSCTSLTNVTIPDSVTSIGNYAFSWCESLATVNLGNGVKSIGNSAFVFCSSLASISIPDSVTGIGYQAFSNCSISTFTTYDNAKYLGNDDNPYVVLYSAISTDITSCTINSKCKVIYEYAFESCTSLTSVSIPDCVISIGNAAFFGCSGLASITIGRGVTSIGNYTFNGCNLNTGYIHSVNILINRSDSYLFYNLENVYVDEKINVVDDAFTPVESDVEGYKKYTESINDDD